MREQDAVKPPASSPSDSYRRLPFSFDARRMLQDLTRLETEDWIAHFVSQNYQGNWDVLPLRGPAGATHPVMMIYSDPTCTEFADTPFLERSGYLNEVLQSFDCSLLTVRLMRLASGSRILEHRDLDLSLADGVVRLHVPIRTNPSVDFRVNGRRVVMREGECWYLDLSEPHSVVNDGSEDRVHLVLDCEVNDWLREQIHRPGGPASGSS